MTEIEQLVKDIDRQLWGSCRSVTWDHPNEVHRMRDLLGKAKKVLEGER
jgi:hypothetical protein